MSEHIHNWKTDIEAVTRCDCGACFNELFEGQWIFTPPCKHADTHSVKCVTTNQGIVYVCEQCSEHWFVPYITVDKNQRVNMNNKKMYTEPVAPHAARAAVPEWNYSQGRMKWPTDQYYIPVELGNIPGRPHIVPVNQINLSELLRAKADMYTEYAKLDNDFEKAATKLREVAKLIEDLDSPKI